MRHSAPAVTGGSARPSWSVSARPRRDPPPRRSASRSATSATCRMGITMQWLTLASAVVFAAWALYISLVEHPARLRIDPAAALAQFRESYHAAAPYQASFAALSAIAGMIASATSGEPVWAVGGVIVGTAIPSALIAMRPTNQAGRGSAVQTIFDLISAVSSETTRRGLLPTGIGVGVPALVNAATGRIGDEALNVPELGGLPLATMLRERFGLPVFVDNDVNALALGELFFGAGRGVRSLVMLAPGTGFGAGVVLDGRLVRGALGFAAEFGHAPVKFDGRPCWCGGR